MLAAEFLDLVVAPPPVLAERARRRLEDAKLLGGRQIPAVLLVDRPPPQRREGRASVRSRSYWRSVSVICVRCAMM
jgi:hypothetical protein